MSRPAEQKPGARRPDRKSRPLHREVLIDQGPVVVDPAGMRRRRSNLPRVPYSISRTDVHPEGTERAVRPSIVGSESAERMVGRSRRFARSDHSPERGETARARTTAILFLSLSLQRGDCWHSNTPPATVDQPTLLARCPGTINGLSSSSSFTTLTGRGTGGTTWPSPTSTATCCSPSIALQDDLIDAEAVRRGLRRLGRCAMGEPLADLLIERGWITADDRREIERKIERKLKKHGGDVRATLGAVAGAEVRDAIRQRRPPRGPQVARAACPRPPGSAGRDPRPAGREPLALHADPAPRRRGAGQGLARARHRPQPRGRPQGDQARAGHRTPRSGGGSSRRRRSPGSSSTPTSSPSTSWPGGPEDDQPFYTMRFVRGRTLARGDRRVPRAAHGRDGRPARAAHVLCRRSSASARRSPMPTRAG